MPTVDRIIAWYRLGSSAGAVVALVVANLIPLVGVLFLAWDVWYVLIVYWLENGVVGVINVLKMSRAEGSSAADGVTLNSRPAANAGKAILVPFFVVHYGLFWLVHGIFVLTLPLTTGLFEPGFDPFAPQSSTDVEPAAIVLAVIALAVSHGVSFWWNFLRGGEYRTVSPARQMFAPYGRLVALHLTIILGAMAIIATGAPAAAVAVLVAFKSLLDLGFHLAEHRGTAPGRSIADRSP